MNIQAILSDWHGGLTSGEILTKYRLTGAQEYAITSCSAGLTLEQIKERLQRINSDMPAREIKTLMGTI